MLSVQVNFSWSCMPEIAAQRPLGDLSFLERDFGAYAAESGRS